MTDDTVAILVLAVVGLEVVLYSIFGAIEEKTNCTICHHSRSDHSNDRRCNWWGYTTWCDCGEYTTPEGTRSREGHPTL